MSALSELLERLRRLRPPPGAAAVTIAVPSPGEELVDEVEFLFADLDSVQGERERILAAAHADAREIEAAARARGRELLTQASATAAAEAAELRDRRVAACDRQIQAALADAHREAERVLERGHRRTPEFARNVVTAMLERRT